MINYRFFLVQLFIFLFFSQILSAQLISIPDIQGEAAATPYNNQVVSTKGAITGIYKDGYFIRDSSEPWAGIYIYDMGRDPLPILGDTVSITGTVTEYYDWTEIKDLSYYEILSTDNPEPEPVILSAEDIDESWESCLIRLEDLTCSDTDLGYGEWEVNDGTASLIVNDLGVSYAPELNQIYSITGLLSYNYGAFKIEPRYLDDIQIMAPLFFTKNLDVSSIQQTELTLNWSTNVESSSEIIWGFTPDLEMGNIEISELVFDHSITINNILPATIIYVKAVSNLNDDVAQSSVQVFVTASESSGEIRVSFNRTLNHLNETDSPELFTTDLVDSLVFYINLANESLDIAMYDFTNHASYSDDQNAAIAEAINSAYNRGIKLRFITDANVSNDILYSTLIPEINVLKASHNGIMHHKFLIIDHESTDNSWIVSGSTNPNYNNLIIDYNNFIAIQDQSLTKAYNLEFNEMWGDTGLISNALTSKFSGDKLDNTPHIFSINGKRVELYFSPSDRTTSKISGHINNATSSVDFAVMAFTEDVLGNSLVEAYKNNIQVRGIIDYVEYSGSEYNKLLDAGIKVFDYANSDGSGWPDAATVHHKFAIVDAGTDNGIVITGSHNWTASAESKNDENTLIIHDREISSLFLKEIKRIEDQIFKNIVPICVEDTLIAEIASQYNYDILSNDTLNSDVLIEIIKDVNHGELIVEDNQTVTYIPDQADQLIQDSFTYKVSLMSNPFVSDTADAIIDNTFPLSIPSQLNSEKLIRVYPNPAGDYINIYFKALDINPELVQLLDLSGKIIYETTNIHNGYPLRINSQDLESGIYLVKIFAGNNIFSRKIVKK